MTQEVDSRAARSNCLTSTMADSELRAKWTHDNFLPTSVTRRFASFAAIHRRRREHAASRVLLDDPLPDDLPLVGSCHRCNSGFSRDEEYLACLIDCVISGSTDPDKVKRPKVRASLLHSPSLAARIASGRMRTLLAPSSGSRRTTASAT